LNGPHDVNIAIERPFKMLAFNYSKLLKLSANQSIMSKNITVIGAGAFGSWTALYLQQLGAQVTLIDAWGPGHSRASSGGETRVIRSVYGTDQIYVELVAESYRQWANFQKGLDKKYYIKTGNLWIFSVPNDSYARESIPHIRDQGLSIEEWEIGETQKKYPQINLSDAQSIFYEREAGLLYAREACQAVTKAVVNKGGTYMQKAVTRLNREQDELTSLQLSDGTIHQADQYVFACGPWLGKLFPETLSEHLNISRQEIYYFGTPLGSRIFQAPEMPVWIDYGEKIFYGIPGDGSRGFKVADDTRGETIDPTFGDRGATIDKVKTAKDYLSHRFPQLKKAPLIESRVCQYTNSPDGHFVVDRHPKMNNLWLAGAGCGHAFKVSPAMGAYLAECVLGKRSLIPVFQLDRLNQLEKRITQFDR